MGDLCHLFSGNSAIWLQPIAGTEVPINCVKGRFCYNSHKSPGCKGNPEGRWDLKFPAFCFLSYPLEHGGGPGSWKVLSIYFVKWMNKWVDEQVDKTSKLLITELITEVDSKREYCVSSLKNVICIPVLFISDCFGAVPTKDHPTFFQLWILFGFHWYLH